MADTIYKTEVAPNGRWYRAWTDGVLWEEEAREQVWRLLEMPFVKGVAVMADTHVGIGGPVGVGVKFEGAIIPSVVGVDIGCGMRVLQLNLTADELTPERCRELLKRLDDVIPNGMTQGRDRGSWGEVPSDVKRVWYNDHNGEEPSLDDEYEELTTRFVDPVSGSYRNLHYTERLRPLRNGSTAQHRDPLSQLGTLGTGNHFFEVSVDAAGNVYAIVHSGSRGAGARIGDYFTRRAQDLMERWLTKLPIKNWRDKEGKRHEGPDLNLAFLPSSENEYGGYIDFMRWAQKYARASRSLMMTRALDIAFPAVFKKPVWSAPKGLDFDIHHNYLDTDTLIARKGAVHLKPGGLAVIPGAMGRRTYIVRGREGLSESMETCSHGAGRAMSRTQALKTVPLSTHQSTLKGLACNDTEETLDETPGSYKDIDAVINAQRDLVEPIAVLTAKVCLKGPSSKHHR